MSDNNPSAADPLGQIADEFVEAFRQGQRPSVEEFARRYPQHADAIRDLLPALVLMEKAKSADDASGERTKAAGPAAGAAGLSLRQLGDYQILREVGRGGMGVVYEATQISLGRHVAVKVLPSHALLDPRHLSRFQREARSAAKLHHTNIVPVFGVGEQDGLHYYVMQFIPGLGLDEVLVELRRLRQPHHHGPLTRKDGRPEPTRDESAAAAARGLLTGSFSPAAPSAESPIVPSLSSGRGAQASGVARGDSSIHLPGQPDTSSLSESGRPYWQSMARIGIQVASALEYASGQGVLHRDIKPSNLLLDDQGNVWVTDFGLAKGITDVDNLTHTGDLIGTLRYMAPERFNGQGDLRSDLYSLGLTLYELLTLRPAFDEADRNRLVRRVLHDEPPRPRKVNPAIPRDLETVVLKAIDRDPSRRYQTAGAMLDDLTRFLEDRPIRARRVSEAEKFLRWCRRNPVLAGLAAAVFLLLLTVAAVASVGYAREAEQRAEAERQRQLAASAETDARNEALATSRLLYIANLNLVQQDWESNNLGRLRQILATTRDHPARGFEWNYWQRMCHPERLTLKGHTGGVSSVAFSPDGQYLVTGSDDGTLRVWAAATGRGIHTLPGQKAVVLAIAFSPDGRHLYTVSDDKKARVWDAGSGRELHAVTVNQGGLSCAAFSPDAARLLTGGGDPTAHVWDARTGREILALSGHTASVASVAFSPDGQCLLTAGSLDRTARVWDVATGRQLLSFTGHTYAVVCGVFSPTGRWALTGSWDATARLWDAATGTQALCLRGHTGFVDAVAFSRDGRRILTGSRDGTARLWDATTGVELRTLRGYTAHIHTVAISPDGNQIVTGSDDGKARVWDSTTGPEVRILEGHQHNLNALAFSADGTRILTASNDGTARIWDARTGRELLALTGHKGPVRSAAFSPDGRRVVTGSLDRTVRIWEATGGREILALPGQRSRIHAVAFSPDGRTLVSGSGNYRARAWDAATGQETLSLEGHTAPVLAAAFAPDGGRIVTGSDDHTARVWDAVSGRPLLRLEGHTRGIPAVAFSADSRYLLTGSWDKTARVWDTNTGRHVLSLRGHTGEVLSVAFSPDGSRVFTGSNDKTVKVWDGVTGREILSLRDPDGVVRMALSPDGRRLVTATSGHTAKVWEAATPEQIAAWEAEEHADEEYRQSRRQRADGAQQEPHERAAQARQEGFIQDWLILAPILLPEGQTSADAIGREQLPQEANVQPRAGDRITLGDQVLVWKEYRASDHTVDFNAFLRERTDQSVAFAVCYLISPEQRKDLLLKVGSDDQARVYLNGMGVFLSRNRRPLIKDQDIIKEITLNPGTNVLVFKVANYADHWQGCIRLTEADGSPVRNVEVCTRRAEAPR